MKNFLVVLIISFLLTENISGKICFAASSVDNLAPACVFLLEDKPQQPKSGTGFFVSENNNLYLITASHVSTFLNLKSPIV